MQELSPQEYREMKNNFICVLNPYETTTVG